MPVTPEEILKKIRDNSCPPMKMKELARAMNIPQASYRPFRQAVTKLIDDGFLVRLKRGRIGCLEEMDVLVGQISINRNGTGFLEREEEQDLIIPGEALSTALDGDKVMVRLAGNFRGRPAAHVIRVLERVDRNIVGLFHKHQGLMYVQPDNPRLHRNIYISPTDSMRARDGEKVVCRLVVWDDPYLNPLGRITERLGMPTAPGVDMLAILRGYDLPVRFPQEILREAEVASGADTSVEERKRLDLTRASVFTIDPADAKDFDDAISIEEIPAGYRLGVHIADVSYYVKGGTALDAEALKRGNSVYLPGMVVPMLPEVLSNDVCSLRPNRRRLAHTVFIEFNKEGKPLKSWIADTVIRSRARLSYEEVQQYFDTGTAVSGVKRVADSLSLARKLAVLLSRRRFAEGSLDFDLPEAKIILNDHGEVIELGNRVRLEAHRLVEEFMLAANREVALFVFRLGQPLLYRVHKRPEMEKLEAFSDMMRRLGYRFPVSPHMKPVQLARFLKRVKDAPEAEFINELMLRSMQKAVYQRENIGHFGLAFSHYTHFTSPIRRYPDLLVHRLIRKLNKGRYPVAFARRANGIIDHVGKHCSETERVAETAERNAVKVKQVAFMAKHLGDEFTGVISGTTSFGFFVRLDNLGAEGLLRLSALDDDYYHFDEPNYRLVGRRTGRVFRLGDSIRVAIAKVDTERSEVELFLPAPTKKRTGTGRAVKKKSTSKKKRR